MIPEFNRAGESHSKLWNQCLETTLEAHWVLLLAFPRTFIPSRDGDLDQVRAWKKLRLTEQDCCLIQNIVWLIDFFPPKQTNKQKTMTENSTGVPWAHCGSHCRDHRLVPSYTSFPVWRWQIIPPKFYGLLSWKPAESAQTQKPSLTVLFGLWL